MHTDIVKQLIANLLPEDVEEFNERAAIFEHDGKLSRDEAESRALDFVMGKRMKNNA